MLRLFTTLYREPDPTRRAEYAECLTRNLGCPAIDEVCFLIEGAGLELPDSPAIRIRGIKKRPTYDDFFCWINELAQADDVSIIANADIFFDQSLSLIGDLDWTYPSVMALSRWDLLEGERVRLFEHGDSQDCWIFRGPILPVKGDFPLGVYDCDNKIAWELEAAGYRVTNPALSLRSYHLHRSAVRGYDPASPPDHGIRPPFRYVEPDNLGSLPTCYRLWRVHRPGYFPWRFTWRKFLRTRVGRPFRYLRDGVARRFGRGEAVIL
jgi:hypothetical protein